MANVSEETVVTTCPYCDTDCGVRPACEEHEALEEAERFGFGEVV
jgi:hypothetical protein